LLTVTVKVVTGVAVDRLIAPAVVIVPVLLIIKLPAPDSMAKPPNDNACALVSTHLLLHWVILAGGGPAPGGGPACTAVDTPRMRAGISWRMRSVMCFYSGPLVGFGKFVLSTTYQPKMLGTFL